MASKDTGSRNICARLVLNDKGTLTITEDPSAGIPGTETNQLLSVKGPSGEVKEFFYGKAPNVQAPSRIDPPDKTDSTHVSASGIGPNKSVLTESQAKSLAVMLSSVNSHIAANDHWVLDHSYTMKERKPLAPPVVVLTPSAVVPPKQTTLESQSGKRVFESIQCSPSSKKVSVYGSANESSYEIMTSPPSTGHLTSRSSSQAVSEHLPKPKLPPTSIVKTESGVSSQNRQIKPAGASEILRQLSASIPVTTGRTSSVTTGPRFQSPQGLIKVPQMTVSEIQGKRPSISGGTGDLKSQETGLQIGNVTQNPAGVLGSLREIVTANLKVKGQDVPCNTQSGKDVVNTTHAVSIPSQKPLLNVPIQRRHYPGGDYVDTYPQVRQRNIRNQNDIDPVLQRMLKNVQNASASLKEKLPVPVSDAFNSNVTPPSKPQPNKNLSEKGNGNKEVIVRVYPDKPVVAAKPDPMKPVNPQSVLPVLTAPPIAFVPYYVPVVMTQTSPYSFPLVYNQCVPSGSAAKTIIVTTNTQNAVPAATPTNSNERDTVNSTGISFSVPSKAEPKIKTVIDQHDYAAVPRDTDMALPRIESVFSLTPSQDTETPKQDLDKDIPKVVPNSETKTCFNPRKTTLRKVESVKIEGNSESNSCLNPGKTALRKVESLKTEDNSESSSSLYPGKTKVRKVEPVKCGKGSQYHTTVAQSAQPVGDTESVVESETPSAVNSTTIKDSNDDGLTPKRRNRKVPKRLKIDYPPPSPKSARKLRKMRPIIFDPCFVVVERISIPSNIKIAKRKKKKSKENDICPRQCREMFLNRLCEKRHLPGNQCKLKVVEDKNRQGKHEPSFYRTVQGKRRISMDDENKPVSPTQEKQMGSASCHKTASLMPGELGTVGTLKISSSSDNATVISTRPLSQETLNASVPYQSKMASVCLDSDRSPPSPSSETVSVVSEACIDSDFSDTSPVKSDVISRIHESKIQTNNSLEKFDGSDTESLPSRESEESVELDEPSQSLESSHLGAPSPINLSEESSKYVEPVSVAETEDNVETKMKGDVTGDGEEESDEEWMNVELEVDPDSEPDEEIDLFVPDNPAPGNAPDPELKDEPEATTAETSSASLSNIVLSDKVQRLKAMLAKKMEQVDNLRKQRQVTN